MSNRYGKNQKRKHRERIVELEREKTAVVTASKHLSAQHSLLVARVKDWDTEIDRTLGEFSALRFELPQAYWRFQSRYGVTVPIKQDISYAFADEDALADAMTISQQRLASLRVERNDDLMKLRTIITVASECDGKRLFFYNYNIDGLRMLDGSRHEREFLARELLCAFTDKIAEKRRAA